MATISFAKPARKLDPAIDLESAPQPADSDLIPKLKLGELEHELKEPSETTVTKPDAPPSGTTSRLGVDEAAL